MCVRLCMEFACDLRSAERFLVFFCGFCVVGFSSPGNSCGAAQDTVSERLRRWTRNPLGSARRGSNPLGVVSLDLFASRLRSQNQSILLGFACPPWRPARHVEACTPCSLIQHVSRSHSETSKKEQTYAFSRNFPKCKRRSLTTGYIAQACATCKSLHVS